MTLCKHCKKCKDYIYERVDRKGNLQTFQYCEGGKQEVNLSKWRITDDGYAYSTTPIRGKRRFYHTLFKKSKYGTVIDHMEGYRNDNRLRMLREVTPAENSQNCTTLWKDRRVTSIFPGVYYNEKRDCWVTQLRKGCASNPEKYLKKEGFHSEYEAFEYYLSLLKAWGMKANTSTEAYRKYDSWKSKQSQQKLSWILEVKKG